MRPPAQRLLDLWDAGEALPPALRPLLVVALLDGTTDWQCYSGLTLGALNLRLTEAHRSWLGEHLQQSLACPSCGEAMDLSLPLAQLTQAALPGPKQLHRARVSAQLRAPTMADLLAAGQAGSLAQAREALLSTCVEALTMDGEPARIDELGAEDVDAIGDALSAVDPLAELGVDTHCPACGQLCTAALDLGQTLWDALRRQASLLLDEVHRLARAYGWSEATILALPERRRAHYLERIS